MFNAPKRLELDYPEMDFDFMPDLLRDLIKSTANQMQIDPVIPLTTTSQLIAAISVEALAPSMTVTPGNAWRTASAFLSTPTCETLNCLA
jgi:hypothetical protein